MTRTLLLNNVGNSVFLLLDISAALDTMDFSLLLEKVSSLASRMLHSPDFPPTSQATPFSASSLLILLLT